MVVALEVISLGIIIHLIISIIMISTLREKVKFLEWDRDNYKQMYEHWLGESINYYNKLQKCEAMKNDNTYK